jgi:hypothetical protein
MKPIAIVGVLLIVVGVIALIYGGITYTKSRTVLDIGPIQAKLEEKRTIPLPPILGGIALAGGIVLLIVSTRQSTAA